MRAVVIRQCTPVFQLLSSEDEALLVRRDALLVLNLGLHIICQGVLDVIAATMLDRFTKSNQTAEECISSRIMPTTSHRSLASS